MAQLTLSDYISVKDGVFKLDGTPNRKDFQVDLPATFVKGTKNAKPILQFRLITDKPSKLMLLINQTNANVDVQFDEQLGAHKHWRTMYELLDGSLFKPGETNEISFLLGDQVFDDTVGEIKVSDVVLLFQQKVNV